MDHTIKPILALEKRLKKMNTHTARNRALLGVYKDIYTGPLGKPVWSVDYIRSDARNAAQMSLFLIEQFEQTGFNDHAKKVYNNLRGLVSTPETFESLDALSIEQSAAVMKRYGDNIAAEQMLNSPHYKSNALRIDALGTNCGIYPAVPSTTISMGMRQITRDAYEPLGWVVVTSGNFTIGQKLARLPENAVHVD